MEENIEIDLKENVFYCNVEILNKRSVKPYYCCYFTNVMMFGNLNVSSLNISLILYITHFHTSRSSFKN